MDGKILDKVLGVADLSAAEFASPDESLSLSCAAIAKSLFDGHSRVEGVPVAAKTVEELDLSFATEHVWQEIQLRNRPLASFLNCRLEEVEKLVKCVSGDGAESSDEVEEVDDGNGEELVEGDSDEEYEELNAEEGYDKDEDDDEEDFDDEPGQDDDLPSKTDEEKAPKKSVSFEVEEDEKVKDDEQDEPKQKTPLDDEFFKVDELEDFLEMSEKLDEEGKIFPDGDDEDGEDEEEEDEFEIGGSADQPDETSIGTETRVSKLADSEMKYADFFGSPAEHESVRKRALLLDAEDDKVEAEEQTSYKRNQEKLRKQITKLEEEALEKKSWAMKGEVTGDSRPVNSLLDATLDYSAGSKPIPVATEEATEELETVIRKRVAEELFDDVVRKAAPVEKRTKAASEALSQEKPKEGLAEMYEKEFLAAAKEQDRRPREGDVPAEGPPKDPKHVEIDRLFNKLCRKLDVLTALHYTPKVVVPETPQPTQNVAALLMEDAVPDAVSDAMVLAPREVYSVKKPTKAETEMTKEERKARRRAKKQRAKTKTQRKEAAIKAIEAADPLVKARKEEKLAAAAAAKARRKGKSKRSELNQSKNFFSAIQQSAQEHIKGTLDAAAPISTEKASSSKLKL
ncbi:hypothetical protein NDN08_002527 [Rhodosorus marinus]|uniref:U3 small nucleolar ribonucleoprotein protein MPP10 n=1 Tax=Rhodosorus marinus TaxID=101924 RepID=A0AAV8UYD4_9RHOD|nr:hypothetical protein NDN08_002527 [Rhodosorus marinus]